MNKEKGKGLVVSLIKRVRVETYTKRVQYSFFLFFFVLGLIIICESEFSTNSFSYTKIKSNESL